MTKSKFEVTFPAEIKQVSSRKTVSLDMEYKLTLVTTDPSILNLGALSPDILVDVKVATQ